LCFRRDGRRIQLKQNPTGKPLSRRATNRANRRLLAVQ
jgi:hypothetical protein